MKQILILIVLGLGFLCGCSRPSVPEDAQREMRLPQIAPDYVGVTVPCNICPLNFDVKEKGAEKVVARLSCQELSYTYGKGTEVRIDEKEWKKLLQKASGIGKPIEVEVFALIEGKWKAYDKFAIDVAKESVDSYISYRLVQPSYVSYEMLRINQRDLTTFEESEIYNNMAVSSEESGQCINCHSYRNYKTDQMLFHMRQHLGGTMIVNQGELRKVDLKTDSTISAGVYPAWNPKQNVIAFSTNLTKQTFHTKDLAKIEVQDTRSDLILYDVDRNEVSILSDEANELEVFPTWSPDGKTLYYCSAHFEFESDSLVEEAEMIKRYQEVQYDLYAADYDALTHRLRNIRKIYDASAQGKSVSLPRVSPDGRYILFAQARFGVFHVWHPDADIYMMDLQTGEVVPLDALNSTQSESYPTWSSNGRWIMVASRRDDGNYTRPYIAYFDANGVVHKPFEVPQQDPNFYTYFVYSYNRPEFMVEPVRVNEHDFIRKAQEEAVKANFKTMGNP